MKTRIKISFEEIKELVGSETYEFPKYSTQILNLANQNAQGTRPSVVGQMSELIQEFSGKTIKEWEEWYLIQHPDAIKKASDKIKEMVARFSTVITQIDDEMIKNWVKDLVIIKTYIGLKFQEAILSKIATLLQTTYKLADPDEESISIDGYIGNVPVSTKPESYKSKKSLQEKIEVKVIYYEKSKDGVTINLEDVL
jgi:hypothetical protein